MVRLRALPPSHRTVSALWASHFFSLSPLEGKNKLMLQPILWFPLHSLHFNADPKTVQLRGDRWRSTAWNEEAKDSNSKRQAEHDALREKTMFIQQQPRIILGQTDLCPPPAMTFGFAGSTRAAPPGPSERMGWVYTPPPPSWPKLPHLFLERGFSHGYWRKRREENTEKKKTCLLLFTPFPKHIQYIKKKIWI